MSSTPAAPSTGQVMWAPTEEQRENSHLRHFARWVSERSGRQLKTYRQIWDWSVEDLSGFWDAVREYYDVIGDGFTGPSLAEESMPGAVWYPQARLNFAENVLRWARNPETQGTTAIITIEEDDSETRLTWQELESRVAALAGHLRLLGVSAGDRVAAVLPNVPEAIIGLLATTSIGAIWTINSPDLSAAATLDRLRQLEPTVLIGADGYRFNGKDFHRLEHLADVEKGLPGLKHTVAVRLLDPRGAAADDHRLDFAQLVTAAPEGTDPTAPLQYERVPFNHPLWVLFSSGTTGAPKGIVHGHGGMTLEALKGSGLNQDMGPGDVYYVAANTSWMVWNTLVNNLITGASVVTYSGSPTYGREDHQFAIIAQTGVTMFATGAAYLSLAAKAGVEPGVTHDLHALRSILSTGSPLPDATWQWVHEKVKADVHLGSDTGGTDICSGFIGSNPLEPVHLGELQGPLLGVAVQAWNAEGERVIDEVGDMVILRPMPSMPVAFWGDTDGSRYASAYFTTFPGVWTQGDWITEKPEGGFVVHGRSDATLNRFGVRLGSADIYAALHHVPEVKDGLVLGLEEPDGGYYMPLFVALQDGVALDEALTGQIAQTIRARTSARHVPDEIIAVPEIPVTHAGKKIEVPLKALFTGHQTPQGISRGSLANPHAVDWFIERSEAYRAGLADLD